MTMFFPEAPSRCTPPVWLLCRMFQDKWEARRLVVQYFRMCGSRPSAPELRGCLRGGGFAFPFAARAQDL